MEQIPRVGLGVLIYTQHTQILLGQRKNSHGASTWAPPGGHLEFGESFEACAVRETLEETGLRIISPLFTGVTNSIFTDDNKHYVSIFMKARYPIDQKIRTCEPDKVDSWQWFSIDKLPDNLFLPLLHLIDRNELKNLLLDEDKI